MRRCCLRGRRAALWSSCAQTSSVSMGANVAMSCYIENMQEALVGMVVVTILSIPLWYAVAVGAGRVDRARVAKFASRQELPITVHNGQQVIGYLATTRRWRAFGLAAGLVVSVAWFLPNVTVNSLYLFAG